MLVLVLIGCAAKIHELYDASRTYALEDANPPSEQWRPDGALHISGSLVSDLLGGSLDAAFSEVEPIDVGIGTVTPALTVKQLEIIERDCDDCFGVRGKLRGNAAIDVGPIETEVPLSLKLEATLRLRSIAEGDAERVEFRVAKVTKARVRLGDELALDATPALEEWGEDLVSKIPPIVLGNLGGGDLPLRGLKLVQVDGGVRAEFLTEAAHGEPLVELGAMPAEGIEVVISEETLLDFARKGAFEKGEIQLDVHAEPTSLDVDGDRFELGLRLWRLTDRRPWWRDYVVTGALTLEGGRLKLVAEDVEQVASSPMAGVVDPLALVLQGAILNSIEDAATQAFPVDQSMEIAGGLLIEASMDQAEGVGDALVVRGAMSVSKVKKKKSKKKQ